MKVTLIQLGCPKNVVDGEWALGRILSNGNVLSDYSNTETVLINTCGFIDKAKEESLEVILNCIEDKKKGKIKKIFVFGCLAERYLEQLRREFPEVDGFFPLSVLSKPEEMILGTSSNFKRNQLIVPNFYEKRYRITPNHYAYVKIGDGCDHKCSFCSIPLIRGKSVFRKKESIIKELELLKEDGVKEAILVSQDNTSYGKKFNESIVSLLKTIEKSKTPQWIRLLYLYPTKITEDFISVVADSQKIIPYFDIPLQHVSKEVLSSMNRGGSYSFYIKLIEKIKKKIPEAALRSTFIVGFPTEKRRDFEELKKFIIEAELDNVGFFSYSKEEGTKSYFIKDRVHKKEKELRVLEVASIQETIAKKKNSEKIGKKYKILVEGFSEESDLLLQGRTYFQSPDIDGITLINKGECQKGEFSVVKIKKVLGYDLLGEIVNE